MQLAHFMTFFFLVDFLYNKTIHNVNKAAAEGGVVKISLSASGPRLGFVALQSPGICESSRPLCPTLDKN